MEPENSEANQINCEQNRRYHKLIFQVIKSDYKVTVIKTLGFWDKNRPVNYRNRSEDAKTNKDPFDREIKNTLWRKI